MTSQRLVTAGSRLRAGSIDKIVVSVFTVFTSVGVGVTILWSGVVSLIAYKLVDVVIGLRVPEEEEREGLDITTHGESAYHA